MQRYSFFILTLVIALLYGCAGTLSTQTPTSKAPIYRSKVETVSPGIKPGVNTKTPATPTNTQRHMALILPLDSPSFAKAAQSVKLGFLTGAKVKGDNNLLIDIISSSDTNEDLLESYKAAISTGAEVVVGPLTRNGVSSLAKSQLVSIPTLALNVPDAGIPMPANLYSFGVQVESEARQIARMGFEKGKHAAFVISENTPLSKRIAQAFRDEWNKYGGKIAGEYVHGTTSDAQTLLSLRQSLIDNGADVAFLALDANTARIVRPYIGNTIAVYATSQINDGKTIAANMDLNGVRFVDMPWLLQPDHEASLLYPIPVELANSIDQQRLYAMGIDAFRIADILLNGSYSNAAPVTDVTGRIILGTNHQFVREPIPAIIEQGEIVSQPKN